MPYPNIVILGGDESERHTHAELLARQLGIPVITLAEIRRKSAAYACADARIEQATRDDADAAMIAAIGVRVAQPDARYGFVLDGYPHTLQQARALNRLLPPGEAVSAVIALAAEPSPADHDPTVVDPVQAVVSEYEAVAVPIAATSDTERTHQRIVSELIERGCYHRHLSDTPGLIGDLRPVPA